MQFVTQSVLDEIDKHAYKMLVAFAVLMILASGVSQAVAPTTSVVNLTKGYSSGSIQYVQNTTTVMRWVSVDLACVGDCNYTACCYDSNNTCTPQSVCYPGLQAYYVMNPYWYGKRTPVQYVRYRSNDSSGAWEATKNVTINFSVTYAQQPNTNDTHSIYCDGTYCFAGHSGGAVSKVYESNGSVVWGVMPLGGGYALRGMSCNGGYCYAIDTANQLRKFDKTTGAVSWTSNAIGTTASIDRTIYCDGSYCYATAGDGGTNLTKIAVSDGSVSWTKVADPIAAYGLYCDGTNCFVGGTNYTKIQESNGAVIWSVANGYGVGPPSISCDETYCYSVDNYGYLNKFYKSNGTFIWNNLGPYRPVNDNGRAITCDATYCYIGYAGGTLAKTSTANGSTTWGSGGSKPAGANVINSLFLNGTAIYLAHANGYVTRVNTSDAEQNWAFNVSYGAATQYSNATTGSPTIFNGVAYPPASGMTCNYSLIPADRLTGASNLWVQNGAGENISISSNGTTWAQFACGFAQGNYTIYWNMPSVTSNCSDTTGYVQDVGYTSNVTKQYLKRNCTLTNPSTTTAYSNVSAALSCIGGWSCNASTQTNSSLAAASSLNTSQGANGNNVTKSLGGWTLLGLNQTEQMNLTWGISATMTNVAYNSTDFDACPTNYSCTNVNGTVNFSATNWCYQETATTSTECGGLSTGAYSVNAQYIYVNYSKPVGSRSSSIWQVEHGHGDYNLAGVGSFYNIYNTSINPSCISQPILQFRLTALKQAVYAESSGSCWNGSSWVLTTVNYTTTSPLGNAPYSREATVIYNGVWYSPLTSAAGYWEAVTGWYVWRTELGSYAMWNEEGMYWDVPSEVNVTGLASDVTPPTTTATAVKNSGGAYTFNTWVNQSVNVSLSCDDGNGVGCNVTKYCVDTLNNCAPSTTYAGVFQVSTEGTSYVRYLSNDTVGNNETAKSSTIKIDTTPPVTSATAVDASNTIYSFGVWTTSAYVNVSLSCADTDGSGCGTTLYCNDTANACTPASTYGSPVKLNLTGTNYFRYKSNDSMGNNETAKSSIVNFGVASQGATTQLSNATVGTNTSFYIPTSVIGNVTCNVTLPTDRVMVPNSLYVQNGTMANVTIASNATTWVSFLCNATSGNYTVYISMPSPTNNCTAAGGEIQDAGHTSTTSVQYAKRNCTLTNPSTLTYANVSGAVGCTSGWTCNASTQSAASLAAGAAATIIQGANGNSVTNTKGAWTQNASSTKNCSTQGIQATNTINWAKAFPLSLQQTQADFNNQPTGFSGTWTHSSALSNGDNSVTEGATGNAMTCSALAWAHNSSAVTNCSTQSINSTLTILNGAAIAFTNVAYVTGNFPAAPWGFTPSISGTLNVSASSSNSTNAGVTGDQINCSGLAWAQNTSATSTFDTAYLNSTLSLQCGSVAMASIAFGPNDFPAVPGGFSSPASGTRSCAASGTNSTNQGISGDAITSSNTNWYQNMSATSYWLTQYAMVVLNAQNNVPAALTGVTFSSGEWPACISGWYCANNTAGTMSFAASSNSSASAAASGTNLVKTLSGFYNVSSTLQREDLNATWSGSFQLTGIGYDSSNFDACPAGATCSSPSGSFSFAALGTNSSSMDATTCGAGNTCIAYCGTYGGAGKYVLPGNLTLPSSGACINLTGGGVLDGQWHTLIGASGIGLNLTNGSRAENLTIVNASTGVACNGGSLSLVGIVNSSAVGINVTGACNVTSVLITNSTNATGFGVWVANTTIGSVKLTNLDIVNFSGTNVQATNGTMTYVDGGKNYFSTCAGNCSWYALNTTVAPTLNQSTYVTTTSPNTNYGSVASASSNIGAGDPAKYMIVDYSLPISYPPSGIVLNENFTYSVSISGGATKPLTHIALPFNKLNVTWNTKPATKGSDGSVTNGAATITSANIYQSDYDTYRKIGFYYAYVGRVGYIVVESWSPGTMATNYRYPNGDPTAVLINTAGTGATFRKSFLSNANATTCSVQVDMGTLNATVTSLANGTVVSTPISNVTGTAYNWMSFACDANTFYNIDYTTGKFVLSNTTCPSGYNQITNYSFRDEATESLVTANATVTATQAGSVVMNVQNVSTFLLCGSSSLSGIADVSVMYSNASSTVRFSQESLNVSNTVSRTLYLLSSLSGTYYTFTVQNEYGLPIVNATVATYKYSIVDGSYFQVDSRTTDYGGATGMFLQAFTPYYLYAGATGYIPVNVSYTPTSVTTQLIKLYMNGTNATIPSFEMMWNDTNYTVTPKTFTHNTPFNVTFNVSSLTNTANIEYLGWEINRTYNGTTTVVHSQYIGGPTAGNQMAYQIDQNGTYIVTIYFKRYGFLEYRPIPTKYRLEPITGLQAMNFATLVGPWAWLFLATICTALVAAYVSRYTAVGGGLAGLAVFWVFTILYNAQFASFVGVPINMQSVGIIMIVVLGAVMYLVGSI